MIKHLSIRVSWHDNKWNGAICKHPSQNAYCLNLPRIYADKNDKEEDKIADKHWSTLQQNQLPPCKAEGASFMSALKYNRTFQHPYYKPNGKDVPHNALKPTTISVPPFSSFAVPFWWMLRGNQNTIKEQYPDIPRDQNPPFPSSWVYTYQTQEALLKRFFEPIKENYSLVMYYAKGANPVDEDSRRLIVGIGIVKTKSKILKYETNADYTYPLWDRLIEHGIRPNETSSEGILLPYYEYLELPEDYVLKTKEGKKNKQDLLNEIKLTLQETASRQEVIDEFTYGSEHVNDSSALVVLGKLRSIVERIKSHGIVKDLWEHHIQWIDRQIGKVKESMGPFPSFGNALLALGFQYGHLLEEDLRNSKQLAVKDNPWDAWEDAINGIINLQNKPYASDLPHFRDIWLNESTERKNLLILLSRFELSDKQIKNWFDSKTRNKLGYKTTDAEILENPYRIAELDEGDLENYPIAVETIDNGLFEDKAIQGENVPNKPQLVDSPLDQRRIRAIITQVLKRAAENGDTLVSVNELTETINTLNLQRATVLPVNYIITNIEFIKEQLNFINRGEIQALQLEKYNEIESYFRKVLIARAKRALEGIDENWEALIKRVIANNGITFNGNNPKHIAALADQVTALQRLTDRKISVLHGPAGTGKTTVLGALFGCKTLTTEGILLLAPTGKARVKLGKMAGGEAFTIAQFLNKQNRFDWNRMKPRFTGKEKYKGEQNVIVDECSMLTEDDLYALMQALDLGHIKRLILVGDPYQLPPIGAGRPFADFCTFLDNLEEEDEDFEAYEALARLKEVVRNVDGENSDTLTLASWYSGLKPSKDADSIFQKLGSNELLNDLQVTNWEDEQSLITKLNGLLIENLDLKGEKDYVTLNKVLGVEGYNVNTDKIEAFQLLSPVKAPYWGSYNLNRTFQQQFRNGLKGTVSIGEYQLGLYDKVIQTVNEWKDGFPGGEPYQLSNGQLGLVKDTRKGFANVVFAGVDNKVTFGYKSQGQADNDSSNLELAYAITVHKSQGSDFDFVFLVIPKTGRIISRELIYTALTRAKKKLILLVEGDTPHWIINLSKPQYSETAKRNTHIFSYSVREEKHSIPYAEGLIHKTKKEGLLVRSKSEVIIANMLVEKEIDFEYEREFIGKNGQKRIPDFTFIDAAGDIIILEHLGMMSLPSYRADWEKKLQFYNDNGYKLTDNLFTTTESEKGGIDSIAIEEVINKISKLI
ncbi:AAA family ATPase [Hyunsoonleella sp. SJ7]|uniref:AAA family ATPase n=1 Tax=Hyunsoonleella aquatilis TaxID=2762758 RepID=A0A923H9D7_9FLAO|nr:AAA family ATPase [Hyunsoonleella aquatilis]MBC3759706.1 AAA family ATPase [Hyunsoonleella aquatilis]